MDGHMFPRHISHDRILRFKYPNGNMAIDLQHFLPTDAKRLKTLMRTIGLNYREREQIARELLAFMDERFDPKGMEAMLREYANATVDFKAKEKEMEGHIIRQAEVVRRTDRHLKSLPSRSRERAPWKEKLKEEKEALKALKEKQRGYKRDAAYNNGRFTSILAEKKKAEKNIEVIRGSLAEWAW